jgi:hypothetical protein
MRFFAWGTDERFKAMIEIPRKFAGRPPVSLLHSRQGAKKKELELSCLGQFLSYQMCEDFLCGLGW